MIIDTHCHLNHEQFKDDITESISRAATQNVTKMIVVGFDLESSHKAVDLANRFEPLYAAIGIHPHDARTWNDEALDLLKMWAQEPNVCAIGEIGLDYYRDLSPRDDQERAFRAQMRLAREVRLPVIIHCRDAYEDTLRILSEEGVGEIGGVMHCWAGTVEDAQRTVGLGMHLGFGGTITYKNADNVRDALAGIPANSILLETDAPYLSPMPYRGKRNEPAYVRIVAEHAALVREVSVAEIEEITTANALNCYPKLVYLAQEGSASPLWRADHVS